MVAKVAVSSAVYAIDKPYSYLVPERLQGQLKPGMRVLLPFGRANRRTEGMVLQIETSEPRETLKPLERILDEAPVLDAQMLRLAAFVRERCFCTFYDVIKAMLPAGLWYARQERYTLAVPPEEVLPKLQEQPAAAAILQTIVDLGGEASENQLHRVFDATALQQGLQLLRARKYLHCQADLVRRASDRTEQIYALAVPVEEALEFAHRRRRAAAMQAAVLEFLSTMGEAGAREICYYTGASNATLRRLQALGLVKASVQEQFRRPEIEVREPQPFTLNTAQQEIFEKLLARMHEQQPGCALLYGVTGSGKTAVYLRLMEQVLAEGKSAILLVPEIALTPQLLSLFVSHFGDLVAVLHSSLRVGERYDEWKRIRSGTARLVIGTRSAVFAPVHKLALLIVDEEQEHSYKSENAPRYHAREVAQYRARQAGALVLLGSATPSLESMYRARSGMYGYFQLPDRYNGRAMPKVLIADMKQELREGNACSIGRVLRDKLEENLRAGKQSILFLNRRGANRLLLCVDCGAAAECPRCSVNMTYHLANNRLMCHYCGHSEALPERCPSCGGHLKLVGTGTQRVQLELEELFPGIRTLRMDADTVSATNPHERILRRFREEHLDVLIGTQMVTKGLNFEDVTLVGVLDADLSLYVNSFRAAETTFSMLTQVIGRSGRGLSEGSAVIQTFTPDNTVIRLAAAQDYDKFYEMELSLRELRGCPPFCDLITVTFCGGQEQPLLAGASRFRTHLAAALQQEPYRSIAMRILGPAPAAIARINNVYRYQLTLAARVDRLVLRLVAALLREFAKDKQNRGITAFADLNAHD